MGKKILLADDSITIQKVIELTFSDEDFEVVTVGNGRLAVERVLEIRPDIVLCDIIMPEKDGYEVCDFIKRHPQLSNVPVLLLTGAFEPFDQERAARVQCDGFLAKPFEPETLIAKVKDLLQKAAARGSSVTGPRPAVQVPMAPPAPISAPPLPPPAPLPPPTVSIAPPPAPRPVEAPPVMVAPSYEAAATVREPLPFSLPPTPVPPAPATEEVRFIPDEPFDDLESAGFAPALAQPESVAAPDPEPTLPPLPPEPEVYSVADELEAGPEELLHMTAEESASLAAPVAEDSSSTVIFRPSAIPWTQQPTLEVPLEARAQASIESAQGFPSPVEEATVFEEVLEEEVESLVGAEPSIDSLPEPMPEPMPEPLPEPAATPAPAPVIEAAPPPAPQPVAPPAPPAVELPIPPVAAPAAVAVPAPVAAPVVEEAPVAAPEPVVPALAHEMPVPAVAAIAESAPSAIESFVGVVPHEEPVVSAPSVSAEISVPNDMVAQIAQRVVAQISEKVVRQIAWEVIPDLAEGLIKKEIERLKAELQQT
jgi:CheY-like chemotaxis protein